jgi:hypothetical protein
LDAESLVVDDDVEEADDVDKAEGLGFIDENNDVEKGSLVYEEVEVELGGELELEVPAAFALVMLYIAEPNILPSSIRHKVGGGPQVWIIISPVQSGLSNIPNQYIEEGMFAMVTELHLESVAKD